MQMKTKGEGVGEEGGFGSGYQASPTWPTALTEVPEQLRWWHALFQPFHVTGAESTNLIPY
jgi:hypothetical protein